MNVDGETGHFGGVCLESELVWIINQLIPATALIELVSMKRRSDSHRAGRVERGRVCSRGLTSAALPAESEDAAELSEDGKCSSHCLS